MSPCLSSAALRASLAVVVLSMMGCVAGGVDVTLAVDPAVSSESELAAGLDALLWILDHDEGLYPPGAERAAGDLEIRNMDADPDLELVTRFPVQGTHLPRIRVLRGGLSVPAFDLRVLGIAADSSAPVAEGAALGLSFSADPSVSVPFNFRDALRPPRVRHVVPADGTTLVGCVLPTMTLVFSRPMDPGSLAEALSVSASGLGEVAIGVAASGLVVDLTFSPPLLGAAEISLDLEVTSAALAADGTPLDQSGSEPGAQPYRAGFRFDCGPPPSFPCEVGSCPWACGARECVHAPQIACVDDVCTVVACSAPCAPPHVCDPLADGCVLDCRAGTSLSACAAGTCDPDTGLCKP